MLVGGREQMKIWTGFWLFVSSVIVPGCVQDQCKVDTDSKGDRVCNFGACEEPGPGPGPGPGSATPPPSKILAIAPVAQQQTEWCWLASAEMIFTHYQVPAVNPVSYQCGIIGLISGPSSACWANCTACDVGSGTEENAALVLSAYPQDVEAYYGRAVPLLQSRLDHVLASPQDIETSIAADRPLELGVTPEGPFTGVASHAIVLVGYDASAVNQFDVVVNDPFPYEAAGYPNPFVNAGAVVLQPGQYQMEYQNFAVTMKWSATITVAPQ